MEQTFRNIAAITATSLDVECEHHLNVWVISTYPCKKIEKKLKFYPIVNLKNSRGINKVDSFYIVWFDQVKKIKPSTRKNFWIN